MSRFLAAILLLPGCYLAPSPDEPADEDTRIDCSNAPFFGVQADLDDPIPVFGRVTSPSGTLGVAGAVVSTTVAGASTWTMTDTRGCFRFDLPEGERTLDAEKGRYTTDRAIDVPRAGTLDVGNLPLDASDARLAVIKGQFDDVGQILVEIGVPFDGFVEPADLLDDASVLDRYDVVFANCGTAATTTNHGQYTEAELIDARAWVQGGGTLYASDWEYELYEGVATDSLQFRADPHYGPEVTLAAQVLDRDIVRLLGSESAQIRFAYPQWVVIEDAGTATPLLEADLPQGLGRHPLAVLDFLGDGRLVYTSFHNEEQLTDDMQRILYELILSL